MFIFVVVVAYWREYSYNNHYDDYRFDNNLARKKTTTTKTLIYIIYMTFIYHFDVSSIKVMMMIIIIEPSISQTLFFYFRWMNVMSCHSKPLLSILSFITLIDWSIDLIADVYVIDYGSIYDQFSFFLLLFVRTFFFVWFKQQQNQHIEKKVVSNCTFIVHVSLTFIFDYYYKRSINQSINNHNNRSAICQRM